MKYRNLFVFLLSLLLLTGCFGGSSNLKMSAAEEAKYSEVSTQSALDTATKRLAKAKADSLNYYSPENFEEAQNNLEKARKAQRKGHGSNKVITLIAITNRHLDRAEENHAAIKENFAELLVEFEKLDKVGARSFDEDHYEDLRDDFSELIELVEEGKLEKAIAGRTELKSECTALRIEATKAEFLGRGQRILDALHDNDADDYAPQSIQLANESLRRAELYININPDDADGIEERSSQALRSIQHAQIIAQMVKHLDDADAEAYEKHVLGEETRLVAIARALSLSDMSHQAFSIRRDKIVSRIAELKEQLAKSDNELHTANTKIETLMQELESTDSKNEQRISQLTRINMEKAALEQQVPALNQQIAQLELEVVNLQTELDSERARNSQMARALQQAEESKRQAEAQAAMKEKQGTEPKPQELPEPEPAAAEPEPAEEPIAKEQPTETEPVTEGATETDNSSTN